ncbi:hypothetical protein HDV63DRAFT_392966 [Trichoderma sp. SZMC 28014]
MVQPVLEIVVTEIGDHTIDDVSTQDGKDWLEAFRLGAETIPGAVRASWGRSYKYPNIAMHFIDYQTRRQHDVHKQEIGGAVPNSLQHIMDKEKTDLYVISPNTPDRRVLYAPQTNVVFFWGIDEDAFRSKQDEFFTAIEQSDSCVGYIWGEIQQPVLSDKNGYAALGKGGVMISGWKSREEHDRDVAKPRVTEAYTAISATVKKTDTWGMQTSIVENNGHFHKWQRLTNTDVTKLDHAKRPIA